MRKAFVASIVVPSVVLGFMACSSSSSTAPNSPDAASTSPTSTSTSKDGGAPDATIFNGPDGSTAKDAGSEDASTADAADGSPQIDASFDAGPPPLNGCTTFTDNTAAGVAAPGLNWGFNIGTDVNHCSTISAGQSVSWTGDFDDHPLAPHMSDGTDTTGSPITSTGVTGENTVTITFPTAGTYGYWCTVHTTLMMGVIKVQ